MAIEVISIGSSSSGNSYIIKADDTVILLDVGLTAKRITGALSEFGIDPEDVDAVLITHEHSDHVKSVRAVSRKCCNALFYASRGTIESTPNFAYVPEERVRVVRAGDMRKVGSVQIGVFPLSHDAREPVGFTVRSSDCKLAVLTDTGIVTEEMFEVIQDADKIVFEANHDEDLLMYGEYPYYVKVRIKGDMGHLSNRTAGETLARMLEGRTYAASENAERTGEPLEIMLAHLSFHNNAPYYARNTIEPILSENGFERDADYTLTIASKDETTVF